MSEENCNSRTVEHLSEGQASQVADLLARASLRGSAGASAAEHPAPPIGSSADAQAFWYAVLDRYDLTLAEVAILEEVARTRTTMDSLIKDWEADGSPTMGKGSMGQPVTDPRLTELRFLRTQYAALVKALALPADNARAAPTTDRRPGRPTRAQSHSTGTSPRWGAR